MRKEKSRHSGRNQRTTIFMTETLSHNLDLLALETGKTRAELVRDGIAYILEKHGYPADQKVTFTINK